MPGGLPGRRHRSHRAGPLTGTFIEPIYNMPSPGGDIVARFGFFAGALPDLHQRPGRSHRLQPGRLGRRGALGGGLDRGHDDALGGAGGPSHDELRLTPEEAIKANSPPAGASRPARSALPLQPDRLQPAARGHGHRAQLPAAGTPSTKSAPFPQITGCGKLDFEPSFTAIPTNPEAAAPTGLDAT